MFKTALLWLFLIPSLTFMWWFWATRELRLAQISKQIRLLLHGSMLIFFVGFSWVLLDRYHYVQSAPPAPLMGLTLIWGLIFLPFFGMPLLAVSVILKLIRSLKKPEKSTDYRPHNGDIAQWSRRKWIKGILTTLPLTTGAVTVVYSMGQVFGFRIRNTTLTIPNLPPALEGLRIAHLTDTHVGKFTNSKFLARIAEATNQLNADIVLFTGDLIDFSIRDLPAATEMMQKIQAKYGVYLVEGNHDLLDGITAFREGVRNTGLHLLLNQVAQLDINGTPVDLLGIVWNADVRNLTSDVSKIVKKIRPGAFPILMSHHPHAFEAACTHKIPLTLAGHTHGGQLMLNEKLGVGSVMFKFWTGLYQKAGFSLWISNGVGNWFPLRVNAPAEIVQLTLRRG